MIRKLHVSNYKSLFDLTLEVGRFNVFIGENGCGKSNLLEAIALAAAAAFDKLDNEFLGSRGIRVTEPELMRSAFSENSLLDPIRIVMHFASLDMSAKYMLFSTKQPYTKWIRVRNDFVLLQIWKQLRITRSKENEETLRSQQEFDRIKKNILHSGIEVDDLKFGFEDYENFLINEDKLKNFII